MFDRRVAHSLLLLGHLVEVELKLRALKDVPVAPAALARAGGDLGVDAASVELRLKLLSESAGVLALGELALNMVGLLGNLSVLIFPGDVRTRCWGGSTMSRCSFPRPVFSLPLFICALNTISHPQHHCRQGGKDKKAT